MTRRSNSRGRTFSRPLGYLGLLAGVLVACSTTGTTTSNATDGSVTAPSVTIKEAPVQADNTSLWDIISAVETHMPLSSEGFGQALGSPLALNRRDEYTSVWTGGTITLADGIGISRSELRANSRGEWDEHALAIVDLSGSCVTVDEVKRHYPNLQDPRPSSPHPQQAGIVWSANQPWGRLDFVFRAGAPDTSTECLQAFTASGA